MAATVGQCGDPGDQGTVGANGQADQGAAAAQGACQSGGVLWKDANGKVVPVVSPYGADWGQFGGFLSVVDPNGYVWRYQAGQATPDQPNLVSTIYTGANCTGTAYLANFERLRYIFQVNEDSLYHVVPDRPPTATIAGQSINQGSQGPCLNNPYPGTYIPLSATIPNPAIVAPVDLFVPPVHPEFVQQR